MHRTILAVFMACLATATISCTSVPLENPSPVLIPEPYSNMRDAIIKSINERGWRRIAEEGNTITAQLLNRNHRAVINVMYTDREVEFAYVSSENLKYDSASSPPKIHKAYNKWVTTLRNDIENQILLMQSLPASMQPGDGDS